MSGSDNQAQLDRLIDEAVEDFLLVPDNKLLERVEELTGAQKSLANEFDRLMAPILSQYEAQPGDSARQNERIRSEGKPASIWRKFMPWGPANSFSLGSTLFSRQMQSAVASLVLVIAGATLSFPLWKTALGPDSNTVELSQDRLHSRNVPKNESAQSSVSLGRGDSVYIAQVVKSATFAAASEVLDRINAKHPSLLKDRSLLVRRADGGENPGAYIAAIGGLKSKVDAEELCVRIRATGDPCNVVNVPSE
jgi:hypothetical protein